MLKNAYQLDFLLRPFFNVKSFAGTFTHKTIIAIACRLLSVVLWFALQAFLVRSMGLAVYGEYVYVLAWATSFSEIASLGMDKVVMRFTAGYHERKEYGLLFGILRYSSRIAFLVGAIFALAFAMVVLLSDAGMENNSRNCFWIAPLLIPLLALTNISESCLRSLGRIAQGLSSLLVIPAVLGVLVLLLTAVSSSRVSSTAVMSAHLAAVLMAVTFAWYFCKRSKLEHALVKLQENESRQWLLMTLPMFFMTLQNAVQAQSGVLLCGVLLGTSQAGTYSLMVRIAALLGFGLQTVNLVAAPMFARLHASGKKEQLQNLAHVCAWISTLFSIAAGVALLFFWDTIEQFLGAEMEQGRICLSILLVGSIINATAGSVGYLLLMSGNHTICVKVLSLGALFNILLTAILIPRYGIVGAAIAQSVTTSLWNIALVYYVHKRMRIWSVLGKVSLSI